MPVLKLLAGREVDMDEMEKAVIEATAKATLAPFTEVVSNAIGWAGGDWLSAAYRAYVTIRSRGLSGG